LLDIIDEKVTHIVMDDRDLTRLSEIRKQAKKLYAKPPHLSKHIVSKAWVEESVESHEGTLYWYRHLNYYRFG
jgi:hypothetical protein